MNSQEREEETHYNLRRTSRAEATVLATVRAQCRNALILRELPCTSFPIGKKR